MKTLALIPARGGSKRLPGKNLAMLGDRSLLGWAIWAAHQNGMRAIVSTDDSGISQEAERYRCDVHWRNPELASDEATSIDVVRRVYEEYGEGFDVVILLQPTSPLRTPGDVLSALNILDNLGGDAVISVKRFEPRVLTLGHADRLREHNLNGGFYIENGAVYILRGDAIRAGHDWFTCPVTYGYVMPPERSIDIDTAADLADARSVVERGLFDGQ